MPPDIRVRVRDNIPPTPPEGVLFGNAEHVRNRMPGAEGEVTCRLPGSPTTFVGHGPDGNAPFGVYHKDELEEIF